MDQVTAVERSHNPYGKKQVILPVRFAVAAGITPGRGSS
jgi:hypothetical protein